MPMFTTSLSLSFYASLFMPFHHSADTLLFLMSVLSDLISISFWWFSLFRAFPSLFLDLGVCGSLLLAQSSSACAGVTESLPYNVCFHTLHVSGCVSLCYHSIPTYVCRSECQYTPMFLLFSCLVGFLDCDPDQCLPGYLHTFMSL